MDICNSKARSLSEMYYLEFSLCNKFHLSSNSKFISIATMGGQQINHRTVGDLAYKAFVRISD